MFKIFSKFSKLNKEISNLNSKIDSLKFDLQHALSVSEKYMPMMKTSDKIQLLILRRNLWTKK